MATSWKARDAGLMPGLGQARSYQKAWLRPDMLAGVTVAAYLVPQVMANSVLAGLPPVAGLWAAIPALTLYALFGSSRQLSVGPEAPSALMTAVVIAPLALGDPDRYATLAATLAVLVGVIGVLGWLLRLGFVADLIGTPLLVGYLAGIAVLMVVGQLGRVTGVDVEGQEVFEKLHSFLTQLDQVQLRPLLLAALTLGFLLVTSRRWPRLPGPLLAVLAATVLTAVLNLQDKGVAVVGQVPAGLPSPTLPDFGDTLTLLLPAAAVLLVCYTDNAVEGRAFADRGGYSVDSNQEFLGLAAANAGSGLFQGFPVSSSGSRTALGDAAGSRTQLHSVVAASAVVVVLLFASSVLAQFPQPALGAIIIYAATRLVDVAELKRLARFRHGELALALITTVGVLALGVLQGILVAIAISAVDMLRRIARPHDAVLARVPGLAGMHDVDDYPSATPTPGLLVYRYDAPLFFANALDFRRRATAVADEHGEDLAWFVLNVEANVHIDITAMDAIEAVRAELTKRGVVFAMARVKQDVLDPLTTYGLADSIGADLLFPTLPTAEEAYLAWAASRGGP